MKKKLRNLMTNKCVSIFTLSLLFFLAGLGVVEGWKSEALAASGTGTTTARVVDAISISNSSVDLAFGSFTAGSSSGTIAVNASGTRSVTGGVTALAASTKTAASFTVSGGSSCTYAITLPSDSTVSLSDGATHTMALNSFVSSPTGTGTIGGGGTQTLTVGGTLSVGANQTSGTYTGTFTVSVDYN